MHEHYDRKYFSLLRIFTHVAFTMPLIRSAACMFHALLERSSPIGSGSIIDKLLFPANNNVYFSDKNYWQGHEVHQRCMVRRRHQQLVLSP